MPRVSIVIPVYNVEKYLALSLQSARRQTLSDIEIICVNDGSTDSSLNILQMFASVDSRIVVISQENGGLSSARNTGIRAASGDIVCFLDSDDVLEESACEVLVRKFEETSAFVVTYGAYPYPVFGGNKWLNTVLSPKDAIYDPFDTDLLIKEASSPFAWRTACKRDFLLTKGVLFDESLRYGEDQVFQFELYPRSPRTALVSDKLLHYRTKRPGSFMNTTGKDLHRLAREHVEITQHVLTDWHELGILDKYAFEALDWAGEFSLVRIFRQPEAERLELLDAIAPTISELFDEDILQDYLHRGIAGKFIRAMLYDRSFATGLMGKRSLYSFYAWIYGRHAALNILTADVIHARPWGPALAELKHIVGKKKEAVLQARWDEWAKKDERLRDSALQDVRLECGVRPQTNEL